MRGHIITRKSFPFGRKHMRSARGKSRYKSANVKNDSVTIKLEGLGDIDVRELNTIPRKIDEEEASSWEEGQEMITREKHVACPNPLLQVNSGKFCPICTAELVRIHGNDARNDTCIHMDETGDNAIAKENSLIKPTLMTLLNGFEENMLASISPDNNILQCITRQDNGKTNRSKKQKTRKLRAYGLPPENEITCSMSKLSMQVYVCSSESTISAVVSEAVQTPSSMFVFPRSSSDENLFSQSAEEGKLKTLCGELLLQLCKARAENLFKIEAVDQPITAIPNSILDIPLVLNTSTQCDGQGGQNSTAIWEKAPEWLQKITREKSQSHPNVQQTNEVPFQGGTVRNKISSKKFKPVLCTKLSVPWGGRKYSTQPCAMFVKTQPNVNFPDNNNFLSAKSFGSLRGMGNSKSQAPATQKTKVNNSTDKNRDSKPKQEHAKRNNNGFRQQEVCSKCKSSVRSIYHGNPNMKTENTKVRRLHTHKVWSSKRHERLSRENRPKKRKPSKTGRGAVRKGSTKYFIKTFFTGTSSETTPKTKSNDVISRTVLVKPRRRKSTFTLPHNAAAGQAGPNIKRKKPEEIYTRQQQGRINSKHDVEQLMSKELRIINKQVKAHEKVKSESSAPMFHACFKHILPNELKNKGTHVKKHTVQQKDSSTQKKPTGAGNSPSLPQKLEKRRFNEGVFSCLIPRVFK